MRYACPSCSRIFYLETKVESPCPACGTMLQMSTDEEPADASDAAAPPAQQAPTSESWLTDDSVVDGPGGGPSLGLRKEASTQMAPGSRPPQPTGGMPSAASWLGAEPAAASQTYEEEQPVAAGSVSVPGPAAQRMPASQPTVTQPLMNMATTTFPAARQAPSGTKLLVVTAASILVALAVATAAIVFLRKHTPDIAVQPTSGDPAEVARLNVEISGLREDLAKFRDERDQVRTERDKAQEELAEERRLADSMAAERDRRAQAVRKTLAALELLERREELGEALDLTVDALKADSGFVQAHRLRGRILAASGRVEEAFAAFENADKAAGEAGGDVEALVLAGELALTKAADRERAAGFYRRAAEIGKDTPYGLVAEARLLMSEGKRKSADAKAAAVQEAAPSLALAPLIRGEIALRQSQQESGAKERELRKKAGRFLARALRLDPNSARACVVHGKLLLQEAKAASEEAGFGLLRLDRQSRAESLLSRALELSPKLPEVHVALAELHLGDGPLHDAAVAKIRAAEAVRLTGETDPSALATLAAAQAASGDAASAKSTIEKAIEIEPKNAGYKGLYERYKEEAESLTP
jgi:tetratricopeptide (TPR) repeat protein